MIRLLLCVLFLIISNSYAQELEWDLFSSSQSPGERVIAVLDAGQIGTYEAASIVGEVVDKSGNWGFTYARTSSFRAFMNFTADTYGIVQDRPTKNVVLRLRRINDSIVHLIANISSKHKGFIIRFRKVAGSTQIQLGDPEVLNNLGELLVSEPEYNTLFIDDNKLGNVGIGTTNPDEKLTVKGNIHAEEIKVDLSVPAPDYVFEKDYALKSLEDVRDYVNKNGHLPEIPSAIEFEKDGISVGEMNILLLKKVEELTLYILEQDQKTVELIERIKKNRKP